MSSWAILVHRWGIWGALWLNGSETIDTLTKHDHDVQGIMLEIRVEEKYGITPPSRGLCVRWLEVTRFPPW